MREQLVVGRQHHHRLHDARHRRQRGEGVRHHGAAAEHRVLLGARGAGALARACTRHEGEAARHVIHPRILESRSSCNCLRSLRENGTPCPDPSAPPTRWLLASVARERAADKRLLAIVAAEPADTQRLADELAFFEPTLRIAVFPDWETLPYDTFSPHQDLISERLATLWRVLQGDVDVVLLPATTALTRLAPPSFLAGTTFNFKQKSRLDEARLKAQLTLRRLPAREPGGLAGRVRGARRA